MFYKLGKSYYVNSIPTSQSLCGNPSSLDLTTTIMKLSLVSSPFILKIYTSHSYHVSLRFEYMYIPFYVFGRVATATPTPIGWRHIPFYFWEKGGYPPAFKHRFRSDWSLTYKLLQVRAISSHCMYNMVLYIAYCGSFIVSTMIGQPQREGLWKDRLHVSPQQQDNNLNNYKNSTT